MSFETDPRLTRTKARLYDRCLPCLTDLLEQLKADRPEIELTCAWNCWKVVATPQTREQCLEILARFEEASPGEYVYGKLGKGSGGHQTFAVMFHTESAERRDQLLPLLRRAAERVQPGIPVFYSRGCGDPYETLLGPWPTWKRLSPLPHPDRVADAKRRLRRMLYGQG